MLTLHGIVQTADLVESATEPDAVEMVLRLQGVGPTAPRRVIVPFALLLLDPSLEPESIAGRGFEADVEEVAPARWVVARLALAGRSVLRPKE